MLHILRDSASFIREFDTVAVLDGEIVGNIVYTKAAILGDDGNLREVLSFGPVSVPPALWAKGIGSTLIRHTLARAKELGYGAVLIYGDPEYYQRFGFVPAEAFGIGSADNLYMYALQALELREGALEGCPGRFVEDALFHIDEAAAAEFDKSFPQKARRGDLPYQERFRHISGISKPRT